MKKKIHGILENIKTFIKRHVVVDKLFIAREQFKLDNAEFGLRYAYPLDANSVVVDLGGYTGEWAEKISNMYGCTIYVFEPIEEFADQARMRFKDNPRIHIYTFGVGDKDEQATISLDGVSSSVFAGKKGRTIELRDIQKVFKELNITKADLLKMNIEGGEYNVLPRMIETGLVPLCQDMQIEFHHFYPDAEALRSRIQDSLKKTHYLTYDYPFFFENWRKIADTHI
ncbi:MAG: methyltransferase FkbM family [Parcubacteria group bacterium]|nr:methyltransferase FkbM family [Parcubacteria group bacterium]